MDNTPQETLVRISDTQVQKVSTTTTTIDITEIQKELDYHKNIVAQLQAEVDTYNALPVTPPQS